MRSPRTVLRSMFAFLAMIVLVRPTHAQWRDIPRVMGYWSVKKAHFVDRNTGWMIATGGRIECTTDGGMSWKQQGFGTWMEPNGLFFVDSDEGWVVGKKGAIFHTRDGGYTWERQDSGVSTELMDVYFVDGREGWIVGARGAILHTTDGGVRWSVQESSITQKLRVLFFVDRMRGWILGPSGTILHTRSGGRTWEVQRKGKIGEWLYDLFFVNAQEGWVVGTGGRIFHTSDGGRTWIAQASGTKLRLNDVCFIDRDEGWIIGNRGTVLHTKDGGLHWDSQSDAMDVWNIHSVDLVSVYFEDPSYGVVIGKNARTFVFNDVSDLDIPTDLVSKKLYVLGGAFEEEHPWSFAGTSNDLDLKTELGWIRPRQLDPEKDLSGRVLGKGGDIWVQHRRQEKEWWVFVVDNDMETEGYYFTPGVLYLDLGASLGINAVRLWFAPDVISNMQQIEIGINEGDPQNVDGRGWPLLETIWTGRVVRQESVTAEFPTRVARYVGIGVSGIRSAGFAEIEIFGEGYVPFASFVSDVMDFGDVASWGDLQGHGEVPPGATIQIRTRSGRDPDPDIYWMVTGLGKSRRMTCISDSTGELLTREEYDALPEVQQGPITTDTQNWSGWSAPYDLETGREGVPIVSPEPRRYFQLRVDFISGLWEAGKIDYLTFEYSCPPPARELFAEIAPAEVDPARTETFVYTLKPTIRRDDLGFDTVEIFTPTRIERVRSVKLDGAEIPHTWEVLDGPPRFTVHLRHLDVRDSWGLLEIVFDAVVLRYDTQFIARVYDSVSDQVDQWVVPGDATEKLDSNELSVKTKLDRPLIEAINATPKPFSPNGDGINDEVRISYALLKLLVPARVVVDVYDLGGSWVRRVYEGEDREGVYGHLWDGRYEEGDVVPPGVYVYRVAVYADSGRQERMGTVVVAY